MTDSEELKIKAKLKALKEDSRLERQYSITKTVTTIGRHPSNDIKIKSPLISRFHCVLKFQDNSFVITDLKSSNGSFINGKEVTTKTTVRDGDVVKIGDVEFELEYEEAEKSSDKNYDLNKTTKVKLVPRGEGHIAVLSKMAETGFTPIPGADLKKKDFGSLQKAHSRLVILYKLSDILRRTKKTNVLLNKVMNLIFESIPADRGCVLLKTDSRDDLEVVYSYTRDSEVRDTEQISVSKTIVDQAIEERVGIICRDAVVDGRFKGSDSIISNEIRSVLCVPLITKNKILGIVHVDTKESTHAFTEDDLVFLSSICNDLSMSIENIKLTEEKIREERITAIGQTITGLAHTIKNILLLSKGGIELMDKTLEHEGSQSLKEDWELVKRSIKKISTLVKDMLLFAKDREVKIVLCNVNSLIKDMIDSFQEEFNKTSIKIIFKPDKKIKPAKLDGDGLYKCLVDIIVNACEAIDGAEGKIEIETINVEDKTYIIKISDDGPGIEPENLNKIFEPFYSTKGSKGTGLGLSITKKVINDMNGDITVESKVGVGTTFKIQIPFDATLMGYLKEEEENIHEQN